MDEARQNSDHENFRVACQYETARRFVEMSELKPVRMAILGASHWHLPCYLNPALDDGHEVVLHDANQERLATLVAKNGKDLAPGRLSSCSDPRALLSSKPNYAILLGKPEETASFVELCLEFNVPFMAEKPGSLQAERLSSLALRCRQKGLFNASPFSLRWDFVGLKVKSLLDAGSLGRIASVSMSYFSGAAGRYVQWGSPWALDRNVSGGGAMFNVGVHLLDLFRFWGFEPKYLFGKASWNINKNSVDDIASMMLDIGGGAYAVLESGYLVQNPFGGLCFSIYAEKANIDYRDKTLKITWADGRVETHVNPDPEPRAAMQRGLIEMIEKGGQAPSGLQDMAAVLAICERLSASI